jgi:hypothetical protein
MNDEKIEEVVMRLEELITDAACDGLRRQEYREVLSRLVKIIRSMAEAMDRNEGNEEEEDDVA